MALTPRQIQTIKDLSYKQTQTPKQIIAYCEEKLKLPRAGLSSRKRKLLKAKGLSVSKSRIGTRRFSRKYYQEIINHYKD